jgi:hypothetical protein
VFCPPSAEDSSPNRERCCLRCCAWIAEHRGMKNAANASRVIHLMALSRSEKRLQASSRDLSRKI